MIKNVKVCGFEGEWAVVADIKTTDHPRYLVENLQSGKLLVTVILNGDYTRCRAVHSPRSISGSGGHFVWPYSTRQRHSNHAVDCRWIVAVDS